MDVSVVLCELIWVHRVAGLRCPCKIITMKVLKTFLKVMMLILILNGLKFIMFLMFEISNYKSNNNNNI